MKPFYHPPPPSTSRDLPSPHSPLRRFDLQAVTSEWLSLTLDPSASTPSRSLATTPVPPTPPPLPTHLTPFFRAQGLKATSPVQSQRSSAVPPQIVPKTCPFEKGGHSFGRTPAALPFSQSPPPLPHSSFSSPLPDSTLQYSSGKGIAKTVLISKPEVLFCTDPEPIKTPTQVPPWHELNVQVNKSSKIPDIELQVKDPYDELFSMVLEGRTSTDDAGFSRLPLVDSPSATPSTASQSRFKLSTGESHQPAVKPTAVTKASSDPAGCVRLEVQIHRPTTVEPLSVSWGGQSKTLNEQPVKSRRPPSVGRSGFTELFIEEEEETREDKEENIRGFIERPSPQVEHGVSRTFKHCRALEEK